MLKGWIVYEDRSVDGEGQYIRAIYLDEWDADQHMKIISTYQSPDGRYFTSREFGSRLYIEEVEIYQSLDIERIARGY